MEIRQLAPHFRAGAEPRRSKQLCFFRKVMVFLIVSLLLQPSVRGQRGDWQEVERLRPGDRVWVTTQRRFLCTVERVTNEEMICEVHRRYVGFLTLTFPRSEIAQIRVFVNPDPGREAAIGGLIGLGVGTAIGAGNGDGLRGVNAFVGGVGLAGVGALIGAMTATGRLAFQHGKIIYKR